MRFLCCQRHNFFCSEWPAACKLSLGRVQFYPWKFHWHKVHEFQSCHKDLFHSLGPRKRSDFQLQNSRNPYLVHSWKLKKRKFIQILRKKIPSLTLRQTNRGQKQGTCWNMYLPNRKMVGFFFYQLCFVVYWRDWLAAYGSDPSDRYKLGYWL